MIILLVPYKKIVILSVEPAFMSTLLTQFEEVLSELQEEMQDKTYCVLPCSKNAHTIPASEKKPNQVLCYLLTAKKANALSEADFLTKEEEDALSVKDFEEIEALSDAELSDAELFDAKLFDAELYK